MDIKVGDIVEYKGNVVRLMATHSLSRMRLTNFGLVADEISNLKLLRPAYLPDIHPGDFVIVRDISKDDKRQYLSEWGPKRERCVTSVEPYEVVNHYYDENYGNVAYVNGLWFHTYHLDPVSDFDIV